MEPAGMPENPSAPAGSTPPSFPWDLERITYAEVRASDYRVAVLPLGATEPHNLHLPYATDTLESQVIGRALCGEAVARGARVVLLPAIPYGTETNMRALPLAMNLNPSTLFAVVTDLVQSLIRSGIRRVVLLNSHGGNDLKPLLRELAGQTEAHLFLCEWFRLVADRYDEIFQCREDHAGEMETSVALAYFGDRVARNADGSLRADDGAVRSTRFEAINRGWVSITRPWHLLTQNTGSGNPHAATAEKGERLVELVVERLAPFLVELSEAEEDDRFPY
jgi:creatinine amidohydrolase